MSGRARCPWAEEHPLLGEYHDRRWGVPVRDDEELFAMLTLEGQQAGLSWLTVLQKEPGYRELFRGLDPEAMAAMEEEDVERLLDDERIVRHRGKVTAAIRNARAFLSFREEREEGFGEYLWEFVGGDPVDNRWTRPEEVPRKTGRSQTMAAALEELGFTYVGPTICYAFMQAVGMVNDHLVGCFRHEEVANGA